MVTVIVNFVSGKAFTLRMHDNQARSLLKALSADPNGATIISDDQNQPLTVIHRSQVTYVSIEP
jgi:hypothetical protein